jgi:hypothetical protein
LYSLHKITVSILLLFLYLPIHAGDPYRIPAGAGETGMGSVCIMKTGFWSSFHNQALLAFNNSFSAGINYNNRFNISALSTRTAGMIIHAGKSSLGIIYSNFGYKHFHREATGLSCGIALSKMISAGVEIDYYSEKTSMEYGRRNVITFQTGLILVPKDNLTIGIHIFNPVPNSLRKSILPTSLRVGAGIRLNKMLFTGAEAEMNSGNSLIIRTGLEYEVYKRLLLRCGFCTENTSFSFGMGYITDRFQLDLGFANHEKLGITSSVSIVFKM